MKQEGLQTSGITEGKDTSEPEVQANIQHKEDRHVVGYVEYKIECNNRKFIVKKERKTNNTEQFYSIKEE